MTGRLVRSYGLGTISPQMGTSMSYGPQINTYKNDQLNTQHTTLSCISEAIKASLTECKK